MAQAERLVGIDRDFLVMVEELDSHFADLDRDEVAEMARVYGVSVEWLRGDKPLRDYVTVDAMNGADKLTPHDRDVIAEFAASLPRRK